MLILSGGWVQANPALSIGRHSPFMWSSFEAQTRRVERLEERGHMVVPPALLSEQEHEEADAV